MGPDTGLGGQGVELLTPPPWVFIRPLILLTIHVNVFLTKGNCKIWSSLSVGCSSKEASEISIASRSLISLSPSFLLEGFSAKFQTQTAVSTLFFIRKYKLLPPDSHVPRTSLPEKKFSLCVLFVTVHVHPIFHLNGTLSKKTSPPARQLTLV